VLHASKHYFQLIDEARTLALTAVRRITGGNFRLITRLLTQMERVDRINQVPYLTPAVVEPHA